MYNLINESSKKPAALLTIFTTYSEVDNNIIIRLSYNFLAILNQNQQQSRLRVEQVCVGLRICDCGQCPESGSKLRVVHVLVVVNSRPLDQTTFQLSTPVLSNLSSIACYRLIVLAKKKNFRKIAKIYF